MRQRHIPLAWVMAVYDDPDGIEADVSRHVTDREIRWRLYDDQLIEIVVDLTDGTIVSAWITRVMA